MASVATMTRTLIDSGCKHIIPVRVNYNFYVDKCNVRDDALLRNKMKFSTHKGDIALCVGTHLFSDASGSFDERSAYPPVTSALVEGDSEITSGKQVALCALYSLTGAEVSIDQNACLSKRVEEILEEKIAKKLDGGGDKIKDCMDWLKKMPDFRFMGYSLGLGYAHPSSGDNVVSALIGGMMTVRNGDFPIKTGDKVMWYFYFERDEFSKAGVRKFRDEDSGKDDMQVCGDMYRDDRRSKMLMQNGVYEKSNLLSKDMMQITSTTGKVPLALVKPYYEISCESKFFYPFDKARLIGRAVSNARPYDGVDIQICTQSG